jgi:hypothetical protein
MRLIQTSNLKTWAASKSAENRFPHIVKALISAVISPKQLRMPSGDAVWLPGFDGELLNGEESRFVPLGRSVWELGTDKDVKGKADGDYAKRSTDKAHDADDAKVVRSLDRSKITFVFVTPLVWAAKVDWQDARQGERIWKDVIVIDGVDLQDWLEAAPAVNLEFAAELGIVREEGLRTADQAWEEWSHLTDPPASEELVVVGREEEEKQLIGRLVAPAGTFTVRGDSAREAWGFALSALRRIDSEEERVSLYARTIVADNEEVAGRLRHFKNLIIVLKQAQGQVSGFLSSRGCHVIVADGNDAHSERNVIVLRRPTHRFFAEALVRMGLPEDEAGRAARACGLSVTILQRQRAHANFERPTWSVDPNVVAHLLPAILAGRWNGQNEKDREILRQLAGTEDYATVESNLQEFLRVDQPPLQKIGDMWTLTAAADAFQLTARRMTRANLDRFQVAFRQVFSRIDPRVEMSPDEVYVSIEGEEGHSEWLRSGLSEALLLIAERGQDAQLTCVQSPSRYAEQVVEGLPGLNDDWRVLASLRDQFARLMEAAPGPFFDSLGHLVEAKPEDIRRLFVEGDVMFGRGPMHTGLLWGLETMAWSPDYLPQAALTLSKLAALDPGGRSINRPLNSLREVFLWWHPGTNAMPQQRIAVIDLILAREPSVGWNLLAMLLPSTIHATSFPTARPRWRDFRDLPEDALTRHAQIAYISAIVDRALALVGSSPGRWRAILNSLPTLNPTQVERALDQVAAISRDPAMVGIRMRLWEMLRDFTKQHRASQGANWVLDSEIVGRLEALLPALAPRDPVERSRWLFDEWLPSVSVRAEDIERSDQEIADLRKQAVRDILDIQGVDGLVKLGKNVKFPGLVAATAVPIMDNLDILRAFVDRAICEGEDALFFAGQISGEIQRLHGEAWSGLVHKEAIEETWSAIVLAHLLMWWPEGKVTWDAVEALGISAEYWRRKPVVDIGGTPEEKVYQIGCLIEAGRAADAFDHIGLGSEELPTEVLVRVFDATCDELVRLQTAEDARRLGLSPHDLRRFLAELRMRADLPKEELARREYLVLPLLGLLNAKELTIYEFMAQDPNLFVEALCDVFRRAHRDKTEDAEPTASARARAQASYSLLEGMERVPGQGGENQVDEEILLQWANQVRKKASDVDRGAIADHYIGQILAHSPTDLEDGGWPHQVVRNVIEKLAAEEIDRGIFSKRRNMRGVVEKALYEGGAQERTLASEYRSWSHLACGRWPRTAGLLRMIAESWEEDARREDIRAEQEKLG